MKLCKERDCGMKTKITYNPTYLSDSKIIGPLLLRILSCLISFYAHAHAESICVKEIPLHF